MNECGIEQTPLSIVEMKCDGNKEEQNNKFIKFLLGNTIYILLFRK